jgi:hypothetical protein
MNQCSICLDTLNDDKKPITDLRCDHFFHTSCIVNALRYSSRCPVCRDTGHDQLSRDSAIHAISDTLLERIHTQAVQITIRENAKRIMKGSTYKVVIDEYRDAVKACNKQARDIQSTKKQLFRVFREKYYKDYRIHHSEFKTRKRRLYRAMAQMKNVLNLPETEWTLFTKLIYDDCGRDTRLPKPFSF